MSRVYSVPTQNFLQKTLGSALLAGTTSAATLNNITSIPNLPGVFIVDRVDSNGTETPSKREVIAFTSTSGSTVVTLTRNADGSGTDQDHSVGAIVEFSPDIVWAQSIYDGLSAIVAPATGLLDTTKVITPSDTQMMFNKMATGMSLASPTITNGQLNGGTGASLSLINPIINTPQVYGGTFASLPLFSSQPRFMGGYLSPFVTISDASSMTIDFAAGNKFISTIVPSASRTFLATNATLGSIAMLRVQYASTASLSLVLLSGAGATISWPGGTAPTPTATLNKSDMFGFVCVGATPQFDGFIVGQNT